MTSFLKSLFSPSKPDSSIPQPDSTDTLQPTNPTDMSHRIPTQNTNNHVLTYDQLSADDILCSGTIQLSLMNNDRTLSIKSTNSVIVIVKRQQSYQYDFKIFTENKQRLSHSISSKLPTWFDSSDRSIQCSIVTDSTVLMWHIQFIDKKQEESVKYMWQRCIAEQARKENFDKMYDTKKSSTTQWISNAYTNDTDMNIDNTNDNDNDIPNTDDYEYTGHKPLTGNYQTFMSPAQARTNNDATSALSDSDNSDSGSSDNENDSDTDNVSNQWTSSNQRKALKPRTSTGKQRVKNQNLAVGMAVNRTFVTRGDTLGVFRNDDDGNLEYVNKINELKTLSGGILTSPSKMMLTNADNKMLLLSSSNNNTVYEMDTTRGEIIAEYKNKSNDQFVIRSIGQTSKYAELENEPLFTGVNKNTVFTMDTRSADIAQQKTYATNYGLNTIATDDSGNTVVGDDKGMLRLYNDISKNAKTLLPGLGDGVIGIDITRDGQYILVTTHHYILLIPTQSGAINGFTKSITNTALPPIKLQLDPCDILKYNITGLNFTPARFDIGSGVHDEKWIISSTGPFMIRWNLKRVLRGKKYDYKLKKTTGNVVADQFIYNKDKQVAVALSHDVYIENSG